MLERVWEAWRTLEELFLAQGDPATTSAIWDAGGAGSLRALLGTAQPDFARAGALFDLVGIVGSRLTARGQLGSSLVLQASEGTHPLHPSWGGRCQGLHFFQMRRRSLFTEPSGSLLTCRTPPDVTHPLQHEALEIGVCRALLTQTEYTPDPSNPPLFAPPFVFDVNAVADWIFERHEALGHCVLPDGVQLDFRDKSDCHGAFRFERTLAWGCSDDDRIVLDRALTWASQWVEGVFRFLRGLLQLDNNELVGSAGALTRMQVMWSWGWIPDQDQASPSPRSWFGALPAGPEGVERVQLMFDTINRLRQRMRGFGAQNLFFRCLHWNGCGVAAFNGPGPADDEFASAYNNGTAIYLCASFWNSTDRGRTRLVMHESMHWLWASRPQDKQSNSCDGKCYGWVDALALIRDGRIDVALDNIDNYTSWARTRYDWWEACWPPQRRFSGDAPDNIPNDGWFVPDLWCADPFDPIYAGQCG